jgi:hypothetical protein
MMTETRMFRIVQHQWLKHPNQSRFHAYTERAVGTLPICGDENAIPSNLNIMEIPGNNSSTCYACFCKLYGFEGK